MFKDDAYLLDVLIAARKVAAFTAGCDRAAFDGDEMLQFAVMRLITIIGEASNRVSPDMQAAHSEVPWRTIIGMRHRLGHDYTHVNLEKVWEVVEHGIPELIDLIAPLVPPETD